MRRLRVLLDANVLVDAQLRDLFLTMAEAELIDLRWSPEIIGETRRALVGRLQLDAEKVDRLLVALNVAFNGASVQGFEHLVEQIKLPDEDDRHVLAAAIHGECDFLVTFNDADFIEGADPAGDVVVLTPDEAVFMLAGVFPDRLGSVVLAQIDRLRRPAITAEGFLGRLSKRAPTGAAALGAALGIEAYERIFEDIVLSQSATSPHSAVQQLIGALENRSYELVQALVDVDFATELVGERTSSADRLCEVLSDRLHDVLHQDGWGFATARRPHAPGVELVKLVRVGEEALIAFEPQIAEGHLFFMMVTEEQQWVLVGLDGPDPAVEESQR
jgi:predicted nucleic acid-binding protein